MYHMVHAFASGIMVRYQRVKAGANMEAQSSSGPLIY